MADNLNVLESADLSAKPVRTVDIAGVHHPVYILADSDGVPIKSINGALSIHAAHVHKMIVNQLFHRHVGIDTTVAINALAGDISFTVSDSTGFSVDSPIEINGSITEVTHPKIKGIAGNVITIDRPLDQDLAATSTISEVSHSLNVVGSIANPVVFSLNGNSTDIWHIVSFILSATFSAAADDAKFGDLAKLANGCILRGYDGATGTYRTFTNWKTNSDIKLDMYDLPYTAKAGGGKYGMNGNGNIFTRTGVAPHIDNSAGDRMELLIQDDLSGLSSFRFKAQGHITGV